VVTLDPSLGTTFSEISREFGIETQTNSSGGVPQELGCEKFEGLLLDFDTVQETSPILATLRGVPTNRDAVVLAVATGSERKRRAFSSGANFVFERPLKLEELRRTLGTAFDLMQRERRRYFRCGVTLPVRLTLLSGESIDCFTMNLSSSGMAVKTPNSIEVAERLQIAFTLPDETTIRAAAVVVWDDKHGKSGLHFQCNTPEMRSELYSWLDSQFAAQRAQRDETTPSVCKP
jgi:hypothetical protein